MSPTFDGHGKGGGGGGGGSCRAKVQQQTHISGTVVKWSASRGLASSDVTTSTEVGVDTCFRQSG